MQKNYTTKNSEPSRDEKYRDQLSAVLSNSQLKNIYKFILNSDNGVTVNEIKESFNIDDVQCKLDKIQKVHLIRQDVVETSTGFVCVYTDDIILPGHKTIIKNYI